MKSRFKVSGFVLCVLCASAVNCFALDREAFTFTHYDLNVRVEPEQQRLGVRGKITLRNDSQTPQKIAVQSLAANALQLDLALKDYGPETAAGRESVRKRVAETVDQIWGGQETDMKFVAQSFSAAIDVFHNADAYLGTLHPSTDQQKQAQSVARQLVDSIGKTRLQMAFALTDPVSYPLVFIVIGWATFLFCAYGLMSRHHLMSLVAVGVGAVAVASAIYLIVDLSDPYTGVFRVSAAPIQQVLAYMNEHP